MFNNLLHKTTMKSINSMHKQNHTWSNTSLTQLCLESHLELIKTSNFLILTMASTTQN